jgi:hypothetical protein
VAIPFIQGGFLGVYPLLAAGGPVTFFVVVCFFKVLKMASPFVATKVTKKASAEMLLCPQTFAQQTRQNQGCNYFALLRSLISFCFSKNLLCPAAAPPTIVLPAFARSCSADGKEEITNSLNH